MISLSDFLYDYHFLLSDVSPLQLSSPFTCMYIISDGALGVR